jgi:hypothetical protein
MSLICSKCGSPTGWGIYAAHSLFCRFCSREGLVQRLLWRVCPDLMRRVRWRQNLREGGWL